MKLIERILRVFGFKQEKCNYRELIELKTPFAKRIEQEEGFIGALKLAERVGRVCYNSEDRITRDSYKVFIDNIKKLKHLSVLEFATIYLKVKKSRTSKSIISFFSKNYYSRVNKTEDDTYYITTNYRVIVENDLEENIKKYICQIPEEYHIKRVCFHVGTSIAISREGNRHRKLSTCERSTRYINFSKNKYEGKLPICTPLYIIKTEEENNREYVHHFIDSVSRSAQSYLKGIEMGLKPQQARDILPLSTYTELYWCAFEDDWQHFLLLRGSSNAHPDIQMIAYMIRESLTIK